MVATFSYHIISTSTFPILNLTEKKKPFRNYLSVLVASYSRDDRFTLIFFKLGISLAFPLILSPVDIVTC